MAAGAARAACKREAKLQAANAGMSRLLEAAEEAGGAAKNLGEQ